MTPEFNKWWDGEPLIATNPYTVNTPIYWAWEGWQAATMAEREACAKVCEAKQSIYLDKELYVMADAAVFCAIAIRARTE